MKRTVVSLIAMICLMAMTLSLVSCGATFEDYQKNLGSDYEVDIYKSGSVMEEILEKYRIDTEKIKVKGILFAVHKEEVHNVVIMECGNQNEAKSACETIEELYEELGWRAGGYVVDIDGVFVFSGTRKAVEKAKG